MDYRGLNYKTRGDSSPQGKPRVYFCCFEEDFERFFEPICKEILDIQLNAAIWYYDPAEGVPDEEELFKDLSQMQLFVIPVTSGFLCKKNRAREVEFAYAMEHHIPVLPLMQEPDLDMQFYKICGDLQYLDKTASFRDPTSLAYEEKLKKFLESVLISDELSQKIRAAFDAYIFLSYRKKDRKYAQEIMRLIHRNPLCRDFAIWYDEFLTPGENFNSEIDEALMKCQLFALVVTPHLLEIPNYVMRIEYPMAKEAGKPILPIEGLPTDGGELAKLYAGIDPAVTEERLSEKLLEMVRGIALQENDDDPAHNFLIGLAYLSGIDVEVDHGRALELITSAAEHDIPEAYKKLVSMYQNGEGVARDYKTAISWQRKYVEYLKRVTDQEGTEDSFENLFIAIKNLGEYLLARKELTEAAAAYRQILRYVGQLDSAGHIGRRFTALAYTELGEICIEDNKLQEASEWLRKGVVISKELAEERDTIVAWHDLCITYQNLGMLASKEGNTSEAKEWFLKVLELMKSISKAENTVKIRHDVSMVYRQLGDVCIAEGNLSEGRNWYQKSVEVSNALVEETDEDDSWRDLALCYRVLGGISLEEKNLPDARDLYQKSYEIRKSMWERTNALKDRGDYYLIMISMGNINGWEHKYSEAREWYLRSLAIAQEMSREMVYGGLQRDIGVIYSNLGYSCQDDKNYPEAKEWYLKCVEVMTAQYEESKTIESRLDLALAYERMAMINQLDGNLTETKSWYLKKLEINKAVAEETTLIRAQVDLANCYGLIARTCAEQGEDPEAKEWYLKCIDAYREISEKTNLNEHYRLLAECYCRLGDLSSITDEEGGEYYMKFFDISLDLFNKTRSEQDASYVMAARKRLLELEKKIQEKEKAKKKKKWLWWSGR